EGCLALAVELGDFWSLHGHFREGLRWLRTAIDRSDPTPSSRRVMALRAAGELAWRMGDVEDALGRLGEAMQMASGTGDARQVAWSTFHLALALQQHGDAAESRQLFEESLERGRALGDDRLVGNALNSLGEAARIDGKWDEARAFYARSIEAHKGLAHPVGISLTLCNLGAALCASGD